MPLDDLKHYQQIDSAGMLSHIDALGQQLASAWQHAHTLPSPDFDGVRQLVLCGMGGSSISGELLQALVADRCDVPIIVNRDYDLPQWVGGPETMIIALSFSGGTEETLSATRQGIERGARLLAITTGGKLGPLVEAAGGTVWRFEYNSQPRAALGWLYGLLLGAVSTGGLVADLGEDVTEAVEWLTRGAKSLGTESPPARNPAKRTAWQLVDRIPVLWGTGLLAPVARRWKTQFNENAKTAAYFELLPELNHNSVVGLDYPDAMLRKMAVIQLYSKEHTHPRTRIRQQVSSELLLQAGVMTDRVTARGESRLAQQMSMIQFGDYMSYYLAMAYEVDPTPIPNIVQLKERLAEVE